MCKAEALGPQQELGGLQELQGQCGQSTVSERESDRAVSEGTGDRSWGGLAGPGKKIGLYFEGCRKLLVGLKLGGIVRLELEHTLIYEQLIIL